MFPGDSDDAVESGWAGSAPGFPLLEQPQMSAGRASRQAIRAWGRQVIIMHHFVRCPLNNPWCGRRRRRRARRLGSGPGRPVRLPSRGSSPRVCRSRPRRDFVAAVAARGSLVVVRQHRERHNPRQARRADSGARVSACGCRRVAHRRQLGVVILIGMEPGGRGLGVRFLWRTTRTNHG